jgi:hypothetical protein
MPAGCDAAGDPSRIRPPSTDASGASLARANGNDIAKLEPTVKNKK